MAGSHIKTEKSNQNCLFYNPVCKEFDEILSLSETLMYIVTAISIINLDISRILTFVYVIKLVSL